MLGKIKLYEVDKVEITTLIDNYIDIVALDGTNIISRAYPLKDGKICNSILAEHGFSAIVTTETKKKPHSVLLDFGFSADAAAYNALALGVNMPVIEAMALFAWSQRSYRRDRSFDEINRQKENKIICSSAGFYQTKVFEVW